VASPHRHRPHSSFRHLLQRALVFVSVRYPCVHQVRSCSKPDLALLSSLLAFVLSFASCVAIDPRLTISVVVWEEIDFILTSLSSP